MKKLWVGCGWLSNKGKRFGYWLLVFAGLMSANLVHSQTLMSGLNQTAPPDSIVQIAAESQGLQLVSPADLPRGGTFWWVMPGCSAIPMPCPPQDPNAIIYAITDTAFLVDQTGGAVTINTRRLRMQSATTTTTSTVQAALSAQGDPSWSYALGAQANVSGVFSSGQLDLDATYSFGSLHKGHSAEFNSDNMSRALFWNKLLYTAFGFTR